MNGTRLGSWLSIRTPLSVRSKDYVSRSTDGIDDLDNIMSTTLLEWSMNPSE